MCWYLLLWILLTKYSCVTFIKCHLSLSRAVHTNICTYYISDFSHIGFIYNGQNVFLWNRDPLPEIETALHEIETALRRDVTDVTDVTDDLVDICPLGQKIKSLFLAGRSLFQAGVLYFMQGGLDFRQGVSISGRWSRFQAGRSRF